MVQFSKTLDEKHVPEWHDYYVNFKRLKGWIHEIEKTRSQAAAEEFFRELTVSFQRVDGFYNTREDAIVQALQRELTKAPPQAIRTSISQSGKDTDIDVLEKEIEKLMNYATLNMEGLRKIAKKFDKNVGVSGESTDNLKKRTSGFSAEWGGCSEELQPRIIERFPKHRFGNAGERLGAFTNAIKEWRDGKKPSMDVNDLNQPLMGRELSDISKSMNLAPPTKRVSTARVVAGAVGDNFGILLYYIAVTASVAIAAAIGLAPEVLDKESYAVIWVTVITLTLLVKQWPSDTVMLGATLFLNLCGLINAREAWGGFSNEVVLSVAALSVVGDIVSHTGFVDLLFAQIIGQPRTLAMAMVKILVPCALGAASISNTAVMACCMPAIEDWCSRSGYHTALFFMPVSYIMLIAGTVAVFSTSTNLVAQALLVEHGLPPLETFELSVPALICTGFALVYLLVATPLVLKRFKKGKTERSDSKGQSQIRSWYCRVQVCSQSLDGKTLLESGIVAAVESNVSMSESGVGVTEVERYGTVVADEATTDLSSDFTLQVDDILVLRVRSGWIANLKDLPGFQILPLGASYVSATTNPEGRELAEVCLDKDCPLVGERFLDANTYDVVGGSIVARRVRVQKDEDVEEAKQRRSDAREDLVIVHGDQLILDVPAGFCQKNGNHTPHFLSIQKLGGSKRSQKDTFRAYVSGAILVTMLVFVAFSIFPLFPCALGGIFALGITGCTTVEAAKKAVPLKVVLTIVGAFGLGNAIGKHGVAQVLGSGLIAMFAPFGHLGLLVAVAVAVAALGVIFHGTAVVALMFPMCVHIADSSGIPIHQMIAVLCISVACQMLSPVSYNTNLMAYAACPEYEFKDFTALGAPLVVLILVVAIPMCIFWFD